MTHAARHASGEPVRRGVPVRPSLRMVGVASGVLLTGPIGIGLATAAPAAAPTIPPPPTKALPTALDIAATYQGGYRCLTENLPGPVAFAKLLNAHYGRHDWGVLRNCDQEHGEGRAMDWMVDARTTAGLALGNSITQWLTAPDSQGRPGAMARRFGLMYIIWNHKMWRAYAPERGWAAYGGSNPHVDHIHFSFSWDGAYQNTSWWTGKALTQVIDSGPRKGPAPAPIGVPTAPTTPASPTTPMTPSGKPVLVVGSRGADVMLVQKIVGVDPDGVFGPLTAAAVKVWQGKNGVAVTGQVDAATWAKIIALGLIPGSGTPAATGLTAYAKLTLQLGSRGEAVSALQKALGGLNPDGVFGPMTQAAVKAYQKSHTLPVTGVVGPTMWASLMGTPAKPAPAPTPTPGVSTTSLTTEFTPYLGTTLTTGSRGAAVTVLQTALGGLKADGVYGPLTASAVKAFQVTAKLSPTGTVDKATWLALEKRAHPLLPYWGTVLKRSSTGPAVVALQKVLKVTPDGSFGPLTEAAVKAAQLRSGLAQTGVVATQTWKALERLKP